MYNILGDLNKTSGIQGSMLVGSDGIIIAADLDEKLEDETVGALAASIMSNVNKAMERLKQHNPEKITIEAGSVLFVPAGQGHRFEDFSPDFAVWVMFYGPEGVGKGVFYRHTHLE